MKETAKFTHFTIDSIVQYLTSKLAVFIRLQIINAK